MLWKGVRLQVIFKKGLIAGVTNLILGLILTQLFFVLIPSLAAQYQNTAIFRSWNDPLMILFFAYPFILGLVLSYFWSCVGKQLKGEKPVQKAFEFAKLYFLIATIPGMFISYTSFQISLLMILTWTMMGFIDVFIAGWIFARMK